MAAGFKTPSASNGLPGSGSITNPRRFNLNPLINSPLQQFVVAVATFLSQKPRMEEE
jgi:hypothetical protein